MSATVIEINSEALKSNVRFLKNLYGNKTEMSVVVKGNAYGHGIRQVIPIFEEAGISHFSVFSSEEAHIVKRVKSPSSRIMIMGFIERGDLEWVIRNEIDFYIFEPSYLERAVRNAKKAGKKAHVHLEIETGMYRTGLTRSELREAIDIIKENQDLIHICGFSTHLAGAESIANYHRVTHQLKLFRKLVNVLNRNDISSDIIHTASSAASISYPMSRMDLVRAGIISYGFWPTREVYMHYLQGKSERADPLKRALRWKSKIMSIKKVPEGQFVGYGYNYQAVSDMYIGIVPVGYSNGYSRMLSNNGHVLVRGHRADVIGTVNMNMILINITDIPGLKPGEEVVLLGQQEDNEISVASFSEMNNSLNYELLSRLPESIERVVI